jgi:hypothetical protein
MVRLNVKGDKIARRLNVHLNQQSAEKAEQQSFRSLLHAMDWN